MGQKVQLNLWAKGRGENTKVLISKEDEEGKGRGGDTLY